LMVLISIMLQRAEEPGIEVGWRKKMREAG
jgi:hypothetical protein